MIPQLDQRAPDTPDRTGFLAAHPAPKPNPLLVPPVALLEVAQLLADEEPTHGNRWRRRPARHHLAAALRHTLRWNTGQTVDPDSGHSHLTHAAARILMALEQEATSKQHRPGA
ncbi:MAG: DUF5664 domain-containing protein [Solirubrobacteraceae bacterium]|nr:DUF5664 domain-containing protein [Solirubrobacteraceae bacterium]